MADPMVQRELGNISARLDGIENALRCLPEVREAIVKMELKTQDYQEVRDDVRSAKTIARAAAWAAGILAPAMGFIGSLVHAAIKHQ